MKDNSTRATHIIFLFRFLFLFYIVRLLFTIYKLLVISAPEETMDIDALTWVDAIDGILSLAQLTVYILAVVFFIQWFRRAYYNLHQSGAWGLEFEESWAAGAWFVPFMNLVRPYRIMMEIWTITQRNSSSKENPKSGTIVGWWWIVWIVSGLLANFSARIGLNAETLEQIKTETILDLIVYPMELAALVLIMKIVQITSRAEREWYDAALIGSHDAHNQESGFENGNEELPAPVV